MCIYIHVEQMYWLFCSIECACLVINKCSFLHTITLLSFCYIHIFIYKLILFVVQYEPELVIVSAGYDSAIGDPKVTELFVIITH